MGEITALESPDPEAAPSGISKPATKRESGLDVAFDYAKATYERGLARFDQAASLSGTVLSADVAAIVAITGALLFTHFSLPSNLVPAVGFALGAITLSAVLAGVGFFGKSPSGPSSSFVLENYATKPAEVAKIDLSKSYVYYTYVNAEELRNGARQFRAAVSLLLVAIAVLAIGAIALG